MKILYNRNAAIEYAWKWAYSRNPRYIDFSNLGGDCTNFISQCIYAGSNVMNFTPDTGWYYISSSERAAAWTSANFLGKFLITNKGNGPLAIYTDINLLEKGDLVQLSFGDNVFTHSLLVINTFPIITVATHTNDAYDRPLNSYNYELIRYLHIMGANKK